MKWLNYEGQDTWESQSHTKNCPGKIAEFEEEWGKRMQVRKLKKSDQMLTRMQVHTSNFNSTVPTMPSAKSKPSIKDKGNTMRLFINFLCFIFP